MNSVVVKILGVILSIFTTLSMCFSILRGDNAVTDLKPYMGGGTMRVTDVDYRQDAVYFTADGVSCLLQFTEPHGWRLRTAKADGSFDDFGAGQTLARDLGEEIPDTVKPITANASFDTFTAPDGSKAQLKQGSGVTVLTPSGKKAYNIDVIAEDSEGAMHVAGNLDLTERLYGTGEKYNALDQRGELVEVYDLDVWSVINGKSYIQIPLVISSRGCGLFMNRYEHQMMDLGYTNKTRFDFRLAAGTVDLYIFSTEKMADALYNYSLITGFAPEPADWTYGTQVCRYSPEFATAKGVIDMAEKMDENGFPWDAVIVEGLEAFSRSTWGELAKVADYVHSRGKKLMIYTQCGNIGTYNDAYMVHNAAGSTSIPMVSVTSGTRYDNGTVYKDRGIGYIDLTNKDAINWMCQNSLWKELTDTFGIDGAKIDFCEGLPDYANSPETTLIFSDGRSTRGAHQWYPVLYNTVLYNFLNENASDGAMVFARGGGIGSQRYALSWSGDQRREYTYLKTMLRAVLSCGLSGMPFMSYDMSGYANARPEFESINPENEVFVRGLEYTCFSANIETHGWDVVSRPYDFDDATKNLYRIYANMHNALRPYLTEYGKVASQTAVPLMRALVLYDQNDAKCQDCWNEYMLGDAFLVAPVLDNNTSSRSVYLPKGSWTDLYTGKVYTGGRTLLRYDAPLEKVPVFVNNNAQSETLQETLKAIQPYIDQINALCGN